MSSVAKSLSSARTLGAGQRVEQRALAGVRVADDGDGRARPRGRACAGAARAASPSCLSWCSRCVTRSFARRRPISSFVSPGPRPPMPPVSRERLSSFCARRGIAYLSCASSTWSLPSAACGALGEDVEDELRAVDDLEVGVLGDRARLRGRQLAVEDEDARRRARMARTTTSSSLPLPITSLRIDVLAHLDDAVGDLDARRARELAQLAHALVGLARGLRALATCRRRAQDGAAVLGLDLARAARDARTRPRDRPSAAPTSTCACAMGTGPTSRYGARPVVGRARCARRRAPAARRPARAGWRRRGRGAGAPGRPDRRASAARRAGACARGAARGSVPRRRAGGRRPGASACRRRRRSPSRPAPSGGRARPPGGPSRATPPRATRVSSGVVMSSAGTRRR